MSIPPWLVWYPTWDLLQTIHNFQWMFFEMRDQRDFIPFHIHRTYINTNHWKEKLHLRLGVITIPMFLISGFFAQRIGLDSYREEKGIATSKKGIHYGWIRWLCKWIKYLCTSSHKTFIERSVQFDEEPMHITI